MILITSVCTLLLISGAFASCGEGISSGFSLDTREGFTLLTPAQAAQIDSLGISFSWEDVGAARYELYADDDPDFTSPEISPLNLNFRGILTTAIHLDANWIPAGTWHWKVVAILADESERISQIFNFNYQPPQTSQATWHPWYRLFNESRRDHFYCSSEAHSDAAQILGYREEGVEGHLVSLPVAHANAEPIYRFWWGSSAVGGHYYTTGAERREAAITAGMTYEGITGYGFNVPLPGLTPLFQLEKIYTDGSGRKDNFFTCNAVERQNAITAYGFTDRGTLTYISLSGDMGAMPWSPWSLVAGMGVSTDNGNLKHHQTTDLDLPGVGPALQFSHQYNSLAVYYPDALKSLGPGWNHEYSSCIVESAGQLFVCWSNGVIHVYDAGSATCLVDGVYDEMTIESANRITIKTKAQLRYTFERASSSFPYVLKRIRDRNSNTLTCQYETSGLRRLTSVTDATGRTLTIVYHTIEGLESLIESVNDPMGRQIRFIHDPATRDLLSYTDPAGNLTTYSYDQLLLHEHQLKTIILPDGTQIDNLYSNRKARAQLWTGQSGGVTLSYNGNTTVISSVDSTRIRSLEYYTSESALQPRRLAASSEGANPAIVFAYNDPQHPTLPSSMLDQRGNTHFFYYDLRGNLIEESHPLGGVYHYTYDNFNNILSVEDPLSRVTLFEYDGYGNLMSIVQPGGHVTTLGRNYRGLTTWIATSTGTTSFSYNGQGNLTDIYDALGNHYSISVDVVGRVTGTQDANGATTQYAVDARGLVTQVLDAIGGAMNVSYDANGQITATNGPGASHTSWSYDQGFLSSYQVPGCTTDYSYHPDGSLASRQRPLGGVTYDYDAAGRLSDIHGATTAHLMRDAAGNITEVDDSNCDLSFTYDALNRIVSTTDCWNNVISYGYDAKGNTTQIVYGPGKTVYYTYDSDDRIHTVTDWNGRIITYSYLLDGLVNGVVYPNGVNTSYAYDGAGRLTGINHQGPSGTIANYIYTRDAVGNITNIETVEPLSAPAIPILTTSYSYNGNGQLVSDGNTIYGYDGNGNVSVMTGARNQTFQFDRENRLISYSGQHNGVVVHDVFGNRRGETKDSVVRRYVQDVRGISQTLIEMDGNGNRLYYYIFGLGLEARISANGIAHYYHGTNVGNVVALTSTSGVITHAYQYDDNGRVNVSQETDFNAYTMCGKLGVTLEFQEVYRIRARYYDSSSGRFISQDPQWNNNLYIYAGNNPISHFDPSGESETNENLLTAMYFVEGIADPMNWAKGIYNVMESVERNVWQPLIETGSNGNPLESAYEVYQLPGNLMTAMLQPTVEELQRGDLLTNEEAEFCNDVIDFTVSLLSLYQTTTDFKELVLKNYDTANSAYWSGAWIYETTNVAKESARLDK